MVSINKIIFLAKKKGMNLKLVDKRPQSYEEKNTSGEVWDFNVSGGNINRLVIAKNSLGNSANIYHSESSKNGIDFKKEEQLIKFMEGYN